MVWKFWKKSKKQDEPEQPEAPASTDESYEEYLLERKKELQKNLDMYRDKAARRFLDMGLSSSIVFAAAAIDWTMLGGLGTIAMVAAGGSSVFLARNGLNVALLEKQLKDVEKKLQKHRQQKEIEKPVDLPQSPQKDFNTSAVSPDEVDKKLTELKKQVDDIERKKSIEPKKPGL